jgi:DNA-binding CsgD family transcriptional regulator/tetratricopeptide (TPR) repeat protein
MKVATATKDSIRHFGVVLTREIHSRKPALRVNAAPLIGRDDVLQALWSNSRPTVVLIGEPGIGKTRLLAEARALLSRGRSVYYSGCVLGAGHLAADTLISLVRSLQRSGRVTAATLRALVESSEADRLWHLRSAFEEGAGARGFVLQVDDLHWADAETLTTLRYCIDRLQDLPIQWHLAGRSGTPAFDEFAAGLARNGLSEIIRLKGLDREQLRTLIASLAPQLPLDDSSLNALDERTAGNPLYLELLLGDKSSHEGNVPPDLRWALNERLRALSADAASVAGWLATNGQSLTPSSVGRLTHFSPGRAMAAILELVDCGIFIQSEDGYSFRHALLRDACYAVLDDKARARRHSKLAEIATEDWQRAAHLAGAGRHQAAATQYNRLGWTSLDRGAPSESQGAFTRALELGQPKSNEAIEAQAGIAASLRAAGKQPEAERAMAAFNAASAGAPARLRVMAQLNYAEAAWESAHDHATAVPLLDAALSIASEAAPEFEPRLLRLLGGVEERLGNLERARELLERGLAALKGQPQSREATRLACLYGLVIGRLGETSRGIQLVEDAVRAAALEHRAQDVALFCARLCYLYDLAGNIEQFERWCRYGLDFPGGKSNAIRSLLMSNLASVMTDQGRLREALGLSISAGNSVRDTNRSYYGRALGQQTMLSAMLGDFEAAGATLKQLCGLELCPAERRANAYVAGYVDELRGKFDSALTSYREALKGAAAQAHSEAHELRAQAGIARTAYALGRKDDVRAAREALSQSCAGSSSVATALLQEVDGFVSLLDEDVDGARKLLLSVVDQGQEAFWRAHLQLIVADACKDRALFGQVIEAFDTMAAQAEGDRARALARVHRFRPGRWQPRKGTLSQREHAIALLVANGKTNVEIGELMHIVPRTVEFHVGNILSKSGLRSRIDIALAVAAGRPLEPAQSA